LLTAARDGLLSKPEELVGRLVILEAMAEFVGRLWLPLSDMAAFAMEPFAIADPNRVLFVIIGGLTKNK